MPLRIAISADNKNDLDSPVSPHFGRCSCFILVDVEGGEITGVTAVDNPYFGNHVPGQVPAFVHDQGADVMLTGGMGRRAVDFFQQHSIKTVTGASGTVDQAVRQYLAGELHGLELCAESQHHHHCQD
jgi:predicted Fe-Mo cluster-binding NifX family protein